MRNPNDTNDPNTPPPTGPPSGPTFYSLAYVLPDGTRIYQNAAGALFTQQGQQYVPYTGPRPDGPTVATPPGNGPVNGPSTSPPPPPGNSTPPPTGTGDFPVFNQPWEPPAQETLPGAPVFTPPVYTPPPAFSFKDFVAPTAESALNDPGYQFRVGQGRDILEHGAAARGILNTGMTLKDIVDYGQNAASQEYQNVYNREAGTYSMNRGNALDSYNTNYKTQYYDPYQFAYKGAYDAFGGAMDAWKTGAGFTERKNQFDTNTSFNKWWDDYNIFRNEQLDRWNRLYGAATA